MTISVSSLRLLCKNHSPRGHGRHIRAGGR